MMLSMPCWAITPSDEIFIAGVADEQRHAFGQEDGKSGGQIVDHDDAFAGVHQRMNHMTSDIAGATGDEYGHGHLSLLIWSAPGRKTVSTLLVAL